MVFYLPYMKEVHPAGRGWKTVAPGLESVMSKYQHPPTGRTNPYQSVYVLCPRMWDTQSCRDSRLRLQQCRRPRPARLGQSCHELSTLQRAAANNHSLGGLLLLVARLAELLIPRQINPQLHALRIARVLVFKIRHLAVHDPLAGGHPLNVAWAESVRQLPLQQATVSPTHFPRLPIKSSCSTAPSSMYVTVVWPRCG
jgi:hypothetical protein